MTHPHREFNDDHTPLAYLITANCDPEIVLNTFKGNATRTMREAGCWQSPGTPWIRKGSKRQSLDGAGHNGSDCLC